MAQDYGDNDAFTTEPSMKIHRSMKAQNSTKADQTNSTKINSLCLDPLKRDYLDEILLHNTVITQPGVYSCAIDSFIDLMFRRVFTQIKTLIDIKDICNNFFALLCEAFYHYEIQFCSITIQK